MFNESRFGIVKQDLKVAHVPNATRIEPGALLAERKGNP